MAALLDGRAVAVKVQYPGVARSIHSDLANLEAMMSVLNIAPPGMLLYLHTHKRARMSGTELNWCCQGCSCPGLSKSLAMN